MWVEQKKLDKQKKLHKTKEGISIDLTPSFFTVPAPPCTG